MIYAALVVVVALIAILSWKTAILVTFFILIGDKSWRYTKWEEGDEDGD